MDIIIKTEIENLLTYHSIKDVKTNKDELDRKIVSIANFFGIFYLPEYLKIKIYFCDEKKFNQKAEELKFNFFNEIKAFTTKVNHIYILKFYFLENEFSPQEYNSFLIHECVHVFQMYFSKLKPDTFIWLYEAVACYLADQNVICKSATKVPWEEFVNNFYYINNCYSIAYRYGKHLFEEFGNEILNVLRVPIKFDKILREVYEKL